MIKVAALTAAAFLIAWAISVVAAYKAGKHAQQASESGVQDRLHRDMIRFINNAVNGTGLDSELWASLSPQAVKQGEELIERYRHSVGR